MFLSPFRSSGLWPCEGSQCPLIKLQLYQHSYIPARWSLPSAIGYAPAPTSLSLWSKNFPSYIRRQRAMHMCAVLSCRCTSVVGHGHLPSSDLTTLSSHSCLLILMGRAPNNFCSISTTYQETCKHQDSFFLKKY